MFRIVLPAIVVTGLVGPAAHAQTRDAVEELVRPQIEAMLPPREAGGVAAAVSVDAHVHFFMHGAADLAKSSPVTADSIFNLASVGKLFATTLLAQAVEQGEMKLDDPVAAYIPELAQGADIRRVTLGQLASHTSGLPRAPESYEQWHRGKYTLPDFFRFLRIWKAGQGHQPGGQYLYSNAGIILLRIALERRFDLPFATLMQERLTEHLGMSSTALPLPPALSSRAVQGYGPKGAPIGAPGEEQGSFTWPGAGQIYSSGRDMAVFLRANLGGLIGHRALQDAMAFSQRVVLRVNPQFAQALGWQIVSGPDIRIVEKNGGLNNTSSYIGLVPRRKLGLAILVNRGRQPATRIGREILYELAHEPVEGRAEEQPDPD
jgi:beta-lactamase class C